MKNVIFLLLTLSLLACNGKGKKADAYGNFEADEISVSPEVSGKLIVYLPDEGMQLEAGDTVAVVDTMQLHLKKLQLEASIRAVRQKLPDEAAQLSVYDERMRKLETEIIRAENLVKSKAAPQKSLDDLRSELEVVRKQKTAAESSLGTQTRGLLSEIEPLQIQVLQIEDQIRKCVVLNPVKGMVLVSLAKPNEVVQAGRPMYKIASLNPITLRAFVSGAQLGELTIGQKVQVMTDGNKGTLVSHEGTLTWVSSEAEFTPRIIQTREERVNQVYAIRIQVPNEGTLKIGMPAEVNFSKK